MPAMLPLALQLSLFEVSFRLFRAALTSCLSRFPLHCLTLIRERLLRLGAHRGLLKGFRRLTGASLGVLRGLARLARIVTEEYELPPIADNVSQDLLIGRLRAEDDAREGAHATSVHQRCLPEGFYRSREVHEPYARESALALDL